MPITVSDHYMTYTVICSKIINTKHDGEKYVTFRSYKHFSIEKFTALLLEDFSYFTFANDIEKSWKSWYDLFMKSCDMCAPLKRVKVKNTYVSFITPEIRENMHHRDFLHRKATSFKDPSLWKAYQTYIMRHFSRIRSRTNPISFIYKRSPKLCTRLYCLFIC